MLARPTLRSVQEHGAVAEQTGEMGGEPTLALGAPGPRLRRLRVVGQQLGDAGEPAPLRIQGMLPPLMPPIELRLR